MEKRICALCQEPSTTWSEIQVHRPLPWGQKVVVCHPCGTAIVVSYFKALCPTEQDAED